MSSHHFVKEQQEPSVFILNTEDISFDTVSPLLEWVPTVLVWQDCVETVLSWGIKVDVILATTAFQKANLHLLEEQYPVRFLTVSDGGFLEEGLQYLLASQHKGVHLVGFDHAELTGLTEKANLLDLTVLDGEWKYYPVKQGKFKKWFATSEIRILGKENQPLELFNSNGQLLFPIQYLTQIELPEGISEFSSSGIFWIGEKVIS
jgi:hypothetical protein